MPVTRRLSGSGVEVRDGSSTGVITRSGKELRAEAEIAGDFNVVKEVQYYMLKAHTGNREYIRLRLYDFPYVVEAFRLTPIGEKGISLERSKTQADIGRHDVDTSLQYQVKVVTDSNKLKIEYKDTFIEVTRDGDIFDINFNGKLRTLFSYRSGIFSKVEHMSIVPDVLRRDTSNQASS